MGVQDASGIEDIPICLSISISIMFNGHAVEGVMCILAMQLKVTIV